jgi:DNA-binding transcriptional ArsR family regulator
MRDTDMLSSVAGLLGEPARTRILSALLGGYALTAKELAYFAGVTAPTASSHLSRLVGGDLLVMEKQGRCHYYRIKSAEVAHAIEGLDGGGVGAARGLAAQFPRGSRSARGPHVLRPPGGPPRGRALRHAAGAAATSC